MRIINACWDKRTVNSKDDVLMDKKLGFDTVFCYEKEVGIKGMINKMINKMAINLYIFHLILMQLILHLHREPVHLNVVDLQLFRNNKYIKRT